MISPTYLAAGVLSVIAAIVYRVLRMGRRESFLPPGPPTVPVFGNMLQFPHKRAFLQLTEWANTYGDIYSLKMGSGTAVVLSSATAVRELLDKNSAVTSDRPESYMVDLVTGRDMHMGFAHYTDNWKALRKCSSDILTARACLDHVSLQQAESNQMIYEMLMRPEDFFVAAQRFSVSVICSIAFGKRAPQITSHPVQPFFEALQLWEDMLDPGAFPPMDFFPILKRVPERWAPWKTFCKKLRTLQRKLFFEILEEVENRLERGEPNGCFMESVCQNGEKWGLDRELRAYLAGTLLEGGGETTATFIHSLILIVMAHPEVQKKAHEELNKVIGTDRAPAFEDIENLPYIRAIIDEVHRFRPVTPLAVPHAASADIQYRGYTIPAGSTIYMNTWGLAYDDRVFEEPEKFNPDRFLASEFGTKEEARDTDCDRRHDVGFGSGRRKCPGVRLGQNSIIITTMHILWAFNIGKDKDAAGNDIEPDLWNYTPGLGSTPFPFKCTLTPRGPRFAEIIKRQYADSTSKFTRYEGDITNEEKERLEVERAKL